MGDHFQFVKKITMKYLCLVALLLVSFTSIDAMGLPHHGRKNATKKKVESTKTAKKTGLSSIFKLEKSTNWSDKSWKVDKKTGVITAKLKKSSSAVSTADLEKLDMKAQNQWYPATLSAKHSDVKSWAMLSKKGSKENFLVGSKKALVGHNLPTKDAELLVFKMTKATQSGDTMTMTLTPLSAPKATKHKSTAKKSSFLELEAETERKSDALMWAAWFPFWATWANPWVWPPLIAKETSTASLEVHSKHHVLGLEKADPLTAAAVGWGMWAAGAWWTGAFWYPFLA